MAEGEPVPKLGKVAGSVLALIESQSTVQAEDVARKLGITREAAKKQIHRLLRAGAISMEFAVSPSYSRFRAKAVVFIRITRALLVRKRKPGYKSLQEFCDFLKTGLPDTPEWGAFFSARNESPIVVQDAFSVAGAGMGTDMILFLTGTNDSVLRDFVTEVLSGLDGVAQTNTAAITYASG